MICKIGKPKRVSENRNNSKGQSWWWNWPLSYNVSFEESLFSIACGHYLSCSDHRNHESYIWHQMCKVFRKIRVTVFFEKYVLVYEAFSDYFIITLQISLWVKEKQSKGTPGLCGLTEIKMLCMNAHLNLIYLHYVTCAGEGKFGTQVEVYHKPNTHHDVVSGTLGSILLWEKLTFHKVTSVTSAPSE